MASPNACSASEVRDTETIIEAMKNDLDEMIKGVRTLQHYLRKT